MKGNMQEAQCPLAANAKQASRGGGVEYSGRCRPRDGFLSCRMFLCYYYCCPLFRLAVYYRL